MIAPLAAAALLGGGQGVAPEASAGVTMASRAFTPSRTTVLAGETIRWTNQDSTDHTVTATDGAFDSGTIVPGGGYSRRLDLPGVVAYRCRLHTTMRGTVDVVAVALAHPAGVIRAGDLARLEGRAPAGGPVVRLELVGAGVVDAVQPDREGRFAFAVRVDGPATFRAHAGNEQSAALAVAVAPEIRIAARRGTHGVSVRMHSPGQQGAVVVLERHERERFGYVRLARMRLDVHGRARVALRGNRRLRLRARVAKPVDGFARAVSPVVVVTRRGDSAGGDHHR